MSDLNGVMMQYFHWYSKNDGSLWEEVRLQAPMLRRAGITALWLPPPYKGIGGGNDVGYGVYDLYDLGEFDQKGSVRTKYGTREQYLAAMVELRENGVHAYIDAVLNHRMGADGSEKVQATPFAQRDRIRPSGPSREIQAYTHFHFPGRRKMHSDFEWHWNHFDAVDHDAAHPEEKQTVYLLEGKQFDDFVALENGNFAYLMGCDLDLQSTEVRQELIRWGQWILDTTKADGFRLDAIKHIAAWFFPEWLDAMERHVGRDLFVVGEYWANDMTTLHWYLNAVGNRMAVFDVPLHFNFHTASRAGGQYDMSKILDGTLMKERALQCVTFVDNHDSQPLQALESSVEPWFKPLAYAVILLRREGYPCIFYPDYYGSEYEDFGRDGQRHRVILPSHRTWIDAFLEARHKYGHGPQYDYIDHWSCIGWTRIGDSSHPGGLAVVMSDGPPGSKWMEVGRPDALYRDATGQVSELLRTNAHGWAEFRCNGGSVSVWVPAG